MKKVDVIDINDEGSNEDFRYPGTYLHGEIENEIGYDIFCFDRETDFKEGVNDLIIYGTGRKATFFLWVAKSQCYIGSIYEWRGLLVYDDDEEFEYCLREFNNRSEFL